MFFSSKFIFMLNFDKSKSVVTDSNLAQNKIVHHGSD